MESNVCKFNQFGFCKFTINCRKQHIEIICDDENCEKITCEKRHPIECRFYNIYKRCKFGEFCRYKHCSKSTEESNTLNQKIDHLENIVRNNKTVIDDLSRKIVELEFILKRMSSDRVNCNEKAVEDDISAIDIEENVTAVVDFSCELCGEYFEIETSLQNHMKEHDTIPQIDGYAGSEIEFGSFNGMNSMGVESIDNSEKIYTVNSFICGLCNAFCDTIPSLKSHIQSHENILQIGNEDNSSKLDFSTILPDRLGRFIPATWYLCEHCDFRSTSKDGLTKHDNKKHKQNKPRRRKPRNI